MTDSDVTQDVVNLENNDRAVILSEEVDWLEALAEDPDIPAHEVKKILDRRDVVRDAIRTGLPASPRDQADDGWKEPEPAMEMQPDEWPDPEDEVAVAAEDADHDYSANRAPMDSEKQRCTICGEPQEAHDG